ncbi:MAG: response regulator, partial [Pirellulales bacterium]|nr:response regulator [Pirellulales bacterium]
MRPSIMQPDVTDLGDMAAERNRQFARLHTATGQLLDRISHDFRTPLTVIKEYATLMHDGLVGTITPRQREFLEIIDDRADDLTTLVDNVLDAGKLSAGVLRIWRRSTDIAEVIATIRAALCRKAATKGVSLEVTVESNLPAVYADPEQLGRMLTNVVTGALSSFQQPEALRLWARSDRQRNHVLLGVTVQGGQIESSRLDTIRASMDSLHPCGVENAKGVALGFALARELVDFHYGQTCFQDSVNGETTFGFSLPVNESLMLMKSYLNHVTLGDTMQPVSLIAATVNHCVKSTVAGVVDEFLQHSAGKDDLVVRVEKHRWLLLVLGSKQSAENLLRQTNVAWSETLDHRPGGLLPQLNFRILGRWNVANDSDELIDRFREETAATVDAHRGPVVLAVDDDTEFLTDLKTETEAAGYQVLTATDGQTAIDLSQSHSPNVVILDGCLPTLDGWTVLQRLREDPATADVPVVVMSARTADQSRALRYGA